MMDHYDGSYLYVFLSSGFNSDDPSAIFSLMFVFLARFLPIIALSPFFGARILPHPVKITFAISIFVIFLPQLLTVTTTPIRFNPHMVLLMAKEFFVGTVIGMIISIPFTIMQNTGQIIDHQRGGASLMVNDPTLQTQSSPLGLLFNMVAIVIFYSINGPFLFLNALITAYDVIPPDKLLNPHFFDGTGDIFQMVIKLFNKFMAISIQLASPALLTILMTDFFLGIANRLAPQVQITFLGMPLKSLLALVMICIGWKIFTQEITQQCHLWLEAVNSFIENVSLLRV